jgi:hypothetical protein
MLIVVIFIMCSWVKRERFRVRCVSDGGGGLGVRGREARRMGLCEEGAWVAGGIGLVWDWAWKLGWGWDCACDGRICKGCE